MFTQLPLQVAQATRVIKTTTAVPVGGGGIVIVAANPARIGFAIWNNSANSIYIDLGSTASSAAPFQIIATFTSYIVLGPVVWTGPIAAVRNTGSGNAIVTELLLS